MWRRPPTAVFRFVPWSPFRKQNLGRSAVEVKQKNACTVFSTKLDIVMCSINVTSFYFIIIIEQWSSVGREGDLASRRDIWPCLETFSVVGRGKECCYTSYSTQDSTHPQKNYLERNIKSVKVAAGSKDRGLQKLLKGLSVNQLSIYWVSLTVPRLVLRTSSFNRR